MWQPGDVVAWRGLYRERVWHVQTTIVIKDSPRELVVALVPGTECMAPEGYVDGKNKSKCRWEFKDKTWELEKYTWHTNRLLILVEPGKYYATMYFWHEIKNEFLCYYINFQLPFQRSRYGINTLDLDLDLIIYPDLSYEWKDLDDYQNAIEHELIFPEWTGEINLAKEEILERLKKRQYPYDGSWLNWTPNPNWTPPSLPENWDKI
jgi:protein associated with RNAse G/E